MPVQFPTKNSNSAVNSWLPTPQYPSIHHVHPPPPQQDFYLVSSVPGTSFDSSGSQSHGNHRYTTASTTIHDYGSVTMTGGHLSQRNSQPPIPSHAPHVRPQTGVSSYSAYPPPYAMTNSNHFYPRAFPGTNVWPLPAAPPPPVMFVYDINPSDVLCGRGGATNSHSGNRAFRSLVKKYQDGYLKAKKPDKPAVASVIVELIRKQGGRFLRRYERAAPNGQVLWVDIGDDRAREKVRCSVGENPWHHHLLTQFLQTCQALRENAPEIRRLKKKRFKKRKAKEGCSSSTASSWSSSEGDMGDMHESGPSSKESQPPEAERSTPIKENREGPISPAAMASSVHIATTKDSNRSRQLEAVNPMHNKSKQRLEMNDQRVSRRKLRSLSPPSLSISSSVSSYLGVPILIRPITKLLPKQLWQVAPIPLDDLDQNDRDSYLRDFVPPCPTSAQRTSHASEEYVIRARHLDGKRGSPDIDSDSDMTARHEHSKSQMMNKDFRRRES